MANTTNFNWETPDDTDLVKDGAAAIRTLGSAIDTSLVDLKGGTTGQILSKATNTDMDFTWIANDVGDITAVNVTSPITGGGTSGEVTVSIQDGTTAQKGAVQLENSTSSTSTTTAAVPASVKSAYDLANGAIAKSIVDAKGDLILGTANDTVSRLAVGATNGHVLTVDNAETTGVKWAAAGGGGMTLLSTTSLSGTSTTVSSISQSYNHLYIVVYGVELASLSSYKWSTNITSSVYSCQQIALTNTVAGQRNIAFVNNYDDTVQQPKTTGGKNTLTLLIQNYASTSARKTFLSQFGFEGDTSDGRYVDYNGFINSTTAIDSFTFTNNGGVTQNSGTMLIYGVK